MGEFCIRPWGGPQAGWPDSADGVPKCWLVVFFVAMFRRKKTLGSEALTMGAAVLAEFMLTNNKCPNKKKTITSNKKGNK